MNLGSREAGWARAAESATRKGGGRRQALAPQRHASLRPAGRPRPSRQRRSAVIRSGTCPPSPPPSFPPSPTNTSALRALGNPGDTGHPGGQSARLGGLCAHGGQMPRSVSTCQRTDLISGVLGATQKPGLGKRRSRGRVPRRESLACLWGSKTPGGPQQASMEGAEEAPSRGSGMPARLPRGDRVPRGAAPGDDPQ